MTIYESKYRNRLIDWDKTFPELDKMSLIKVFIAIVASCTPENLWYSNKETIASIAWRWQIAISTVKAALAILEEKLFLTRKTRGVYIVNKEYLV